VRQQRSHLAASGMEAASERASGFRPFLKEFVKRKRFSPGWLRNGSARRRSRTLRVRRARRFPRSYCCVVLRARLGCRRYGKSQSFLSDAIAPNSFLRKVPPTCIVSSSARSRDRADADVSGANSSPPGPLQPERRAAGLGQCWPRPPHPRTESSGPPTGGISSCPRATPIEQPGRSLLPHPPLCFIRLGGLFLATTVTPTWAGGRALLAKQPQRRPGGRHRTGRHEAALSHSGLAPRR
jgi:hypothetical protein